MNLENNLPNNIYQMPDIILLDARMSGLGGIEATREILKLSPESKVIAISSVASGVIPSQMLRSGAKGFITKSVPIEELLKAIRAVNDGDHYVTPSVATRLAADPFSDDGGGSLFDKLSRRELQIGQMLTDGQKVSQISIYLDLSPKTVYSYRYRIFEKLGIRSDVELTILAVKHGLADDTREYDGLPSVSSIASEASNGFCSQLDRGLAPRFACFYPRQSNTLVPMLSPWLRLRAASANLPVIPVNRPQCR